MSLRIKRGMRLVYCGNRHHMKGVKGEVIFRDGHHTCLYLRADCGTMYNLPSRTGVWEEASKASPEPAVGQVWEGVLTKYRKTITRVSGDMVTFRRKSADFGYRRSKDLFLSSHTFLSEAPEESVIDNRKFILWNPKHPSPPSVILEGKSQAKAVAHKMAESNPDATFYICELGAVTKTTEVVSRNVSVEDL